MDGTNLGLCPVVDFGISSVQSWDAAARGLVN